MRSTGSIQGVELQILLDSGSSDNFLQSRMAWFLQLLVEPTDAFQVLVGNGNTLHAEGYINDLLVLVQSQLLKVPVYLFPIAGADLVLGASWLSTLGPHIADYSALTLKFYLVNKFVTLHGVKPTLPTKAQFHHIKRLCATHAIAEYFTLQVHNENSKVEPQWPSHPIYPPTFITYCLNTKEFLPLFRAYHYTDHKTMPFPWLKAATLWKCAHIGTLIAKKNSSSWWSRTCWPRASSNPALVHFLLPFASEEERWHMAFLYRLSCLKCYHH